MIIRLQEDFEMKKQNAGYYAVIPASVRYDNSVYAKNAFCMGK